jgi:outer membrane protein assembly factor BamC
MEIEMLRRLMLKLGVPNQQATQLVAAPAAAQQATSRLEQRGSQTVLLINEGFDRSWRRVGLSLDRTGFTVEDRDRSQGVYFVRYVEPKAPGEAEPGFFGRLFSGAPKDRAPQKYRIQVRGETERSTVSILDSEGQPVLTEQAQRILKVIGEDLR